MPQERESLEVDFTCDELLPALAQLQAGKAPGLNGFPAEFWWLVWPQTVPLLLENHCGGGGEGRATT
ncbi:hypothetical protein NDU88_000598 [Pleurodeles waltl]|uniref:Uncharacterized protein n=1 Tax=Pleurodeles waltl TaxID=8319 RepID=A0AAV7WFZ0_PLEWA|nr:hypothetical protein NDU88_000598 [Pleurodeles waltl]